MVKRYKIWNLIMIGIAFSWFGFLLVFPSAIVALAPKYSMETFGPTTEQQIIMGFEQTLNSDYDLLILGNSRIYRGVDPDELNIKAYNFANDNDFFHEMYYKLLYSCGHHKQPEYLIVGVDYFQFSGVLGDFRYELYSKYFGQKYHNNGLPEKSPLFNNNIITAMKQRIYQSEVWMDMISAKTDSTQPPAMKKRNGQYVIRSRHLSEADTVKRTYNILPLQDEYFYKILDYAKAEGITVILLMPPARPCELINYPPNIIMEFDNKFTAAAKERGCYFLNYSLDRDFSLSDYSDVTHLNENGAKKLSRKLNLEITQIRKGKHP